MLSSFPMEENAEILMSVDVIYTIVPSIQSLVFNNFDVHFKSLKHLKGDYSNTTPIGLYVDIRLT